MRETVHVDLPGRAYDVLIGTGLLQEAGALIAPLLSRPRAFIVADETVAALHLASLESALNAAEIEAVALRLPCLLYTSPSPRDQRGSRMPSSA